MNVSKQFTDLMVAFGDFFRRYTEIGFEFNGMEITVKSVLIWTVLAVILIRIIIK